MKKQKRVLELGDSPGDDSRKRILETALAEFAEHGIAGARVDRIAERAKVNKALIYYYYGKKQELYEETITAYLGEAISTVRQRLLEETDSLEEALMVLAEHYSRVFLSRPEVPRLILRELAASDSELVPRWAGRIAESGIPGTLRRHLEAAQRAGDLRPIDPRQAVVSFITMQIGYILMSPLIDRVLQIEDREEFITSRSHAVVDLFLHGVKAR